MRRRNFSRPWTARKGTISNAGGGGSSWPMARRRGRGSTTIGERATARALWPTATIGGSVRRAVETCVHESRSPVGAIGPRPEAHRPRRIPMTLTAAELVKSDHEHLIHPLHHPVDTAEPMIYVRGRGATLTDIGGKEYIDGLAGLWNVNVGH